MNFAIDATIIAIIAIFTFIGYKQGLIKSAIKILSFFIAIIIAVIFYKTFATLVIEHTDIDERMQSTITAKILPEGMSEDDEVNEKTKITTTIVETANKTIKTVCQDLTIKIIQVACFLILFIVIKIILRFISALSSLITKIPGIKQIDKLGGTIFGVIKGTFIVLVIFAIINISAPFIKNDYIKKVDESYLGSWIYNNNILLNIIAKNN